MVIFGNDPCCWVRYFVCSSFVKRAYYHVRKFKAIWCLGLSLVEIVGDEPLLWISIWFLLRPFMLCLEIISWIFHLHFHAYCSDYQIFLSFQFFKYVCPFLSFFHLILFCDRVYILFPFDLSLVFAWGQTQILAYGSLISVFLNTILALMWSDFIWFNCFSIQIWLRYWLCYFLDSFCRSHRSWAENWNKFCQTRKKTKTEKNIVRPCTKTKLVYQNTVHVKPLTSRRSSEPHTVNLCTSTRSVWNLGVNHFRPDAYTATHVLFHGPCIAFEFLRLILESSFRKSIGQFLRNFHSWESKKIFSEEFKKGE